MDLASDVIREYVIRLNAEPAAFDYKGALNEMSKVTLKSITGEDVERTIEPFLYRWGWMWRVLERDEYIGWQADLAGQIQSKYASLDDLKTKELEAVDLTKHEQEIKGCYESFQEAVGSIAAAKALHFICPTLLPPWDRKIAKAAKRERSQGTQTASKTKEYSAEDYFLFVGQVQDFIRRRVDVISELASRYHKSKVKIADECLWSATQRPLCLFF